MAQLDSTRVYGNLTINLDADVKGSIKEGGTLLSNKYVDYNNTITISAGNGLTGGGSITLGDEGSITINHDTSSQNSVSNSGRSYIQSVTLDDYGHVTNLSTATETVTNSNNYLSEVSGSGNDTITFTRSGLSDLTLDISHNHDDDYAPIHTHPYDNYNYWDLLVDGEDKANIGSKDNFNLVGGSNVSLSYSSTNNTITINSTDTNTDTNYYLNDISGSGNGTVTFDMTGRSDITWDASHTHDLQTEGFATETWVEDKGYLTSLPSHDHDNRYYTESEIGDLLDNKSDIDHSHNSYISNSKIDVYNAKDGDYNSGDDHIMLLCPAGSSHNVLGTLWMQRTTGHRGVTKVDILYSTGSDETEREAQIFVTQADYYSGEFTIEIFDVDGTDYIGLRRQGKRYFITDAWFTGYSSYTGSLFCKWYVTPSSTTEIPCDGNSMIGKKKVATENWVDDRIATGSSSFVGDGDERSISHGLGSTPSSVQVTPTEDPDGYLGEIWVRKTSTTIYVGNSGSATVDFDWVAYK